MESFSEEHPAITHFPNPVIPEAFLRSSEERRSLIEEKMKEILEIIGLDLQDQSLKKTPYRVAKLLVEELCFGLEPKNFPSITVHKEKTGQEEIVIVKNISFISTCEHHLVPMIGRVFVAYLPHDRIIGLSKINRIVHYFSKRPQLQERLTAQIADSLSMVLENPDIAVSVSAKHFCIIARGVEDTQSETETHMLLGKFKSDPARRKEFFDAVASNKTTIY